jgi:hypothetical protein
MYILKPIPTEGKSVEQIMEETRAAIAACLRPGIDDVPIRKGKGAAGEGSVANGSGSGAANGEVKAAAAAAAAGGDSKKGH